MDEELFSIEWCIRGCHVYKAIWDAAMGEELPCEREPANLADVCAVAVIKDGQCVGHIPQNVNNDYLVYVNILFILLVQQQL